MKIPPPLLWLSEKILENKLEALLLGATTCLVGISVWFQSGIEAFVSKVFPTPDIALVTVLTEVSLLLSLVMLFAYLWFRRNYIHKRPKFSKVTDIQKSILKELTETEHPSDIAEKLGTDLNSVKCQLHLLRENILVDRRPYTSGDFWYLTEHGSCYVNFLNHPSR